MTNFVSQITGMTLYLSWLLHKNWQFTQNRLSFFAHFFSGKVENFGNLTCVKRWTNFMCLMNMPTCGEAPPMHYAARAMGAMTLRISELCLSFSPHPNISDGNVNLVHHFFRIQIFQINEKGSRWAWIRWRRRKKWKKSHKSDIWPPAASKKWGEIFGEYFFQT